MCGRYSLGLSNEEVYDGLEARLPQLFEQGRPRWEREQDHRPRYNVAPRQRAAVIHRDSEDQNGGAMIEEMQWGLIPHWTKHPPSGGLNTINARSEGLLDASSGGMWHALKGYKRCIVPAQGYYEWLKRPSSKIAHFTRNPLTPKSTISNPPLIFFAGLYDHVKYLSPVESRFQPSTENDLEPYPTGNPLPLGTFTILTTSPSKDIEWLHDRMPCILDSWDDIKRWLDLGEMKGWEEGKGGTGDLLKGFPGLDCYPVPPEVGKVGKESPTFIQPVSERSDGIKSFFNKQSPAKPKAESVLKSNAKDGPRMEEKLGRKAKEEPESPESSTSRSRRSAKEDPEEVKEERGVKGDPEGIKSEITPKDEEKGLGDDSNAPNPSSDIEPIDPPDEQDLKVEKEVRESKGSNEDGKELEEHDEGRKEKEEKEDLSTTLTKRKRDEKGGAGQRTKVIRRDDDSKSAQPAITNFFKSPGKPKKEDPPPRRTSSRKKT